MNKTNICQLLLLVVIQLSYAQKPFDCNGRMFRVVEQADEMWLQEIVLDASDQATFIDLQSFGDHNINGIAYNQKEDLIYGIIIGSPYKLCRIDADYNLEILSDLPLPTDFTFVAGDISPDGKHLVLLGFKNGIPYNLIAKINLDNSAYETDVITTQSIGNQHVYCADIAFHPVTNILFGFDHAQGKLITVDLERYEIDNNTYPKLSTLNGNMPTLFFDAKGRLFGIGSKQNFSYERHLYQFDVTDGSATQLQELAYDTYQDGCSCPIRVELLQAVSSRVGHPCGELEFTFTLLNKTGSTIDQLTFENSFPENTQILNVSELPFVGDLQIQGQTILINQITLPHGRFEFTVRLSYDALLQSRSYSSQSSLSSPVLNELLGTQTILSDDPLTVAFDDPTYFQLQAMKSIAFEQAEVLFCQGKTVEVPVPIKGDYTYAWSDGTTDSSILVQAPGWYELTVTSSCGVAIGGFEAVWDEIDLTLGDDQVVERNEAITIQPIVHSSSPIVSYQWHSSAAVMPICSRCPDLQFATPEDLTYELTVRNQTGCVSQDDIHVEVVGFELYAPNAFSPNGNGKNEVFFLQSRWANDITRFTVFDRWGNVIWQKRNITTNDESSGWDGYIGNQKAPAGVYIWQAEILTRGGETKQFSGEINLFLRQNLD